MKVLWGPLASWSGPYSFTNFRVWYCGKRTRNVSGPYPTSGWRLPSFRADVQSSMRWVAVFAPVALKLMIEPNCLVRSLVDLSTKPAPTTITTSPAAPAAAITGRRRMSGSRSAPSSTTTTMVASQAPRVPVWSISRSSAAVIAAMSPRTSQFRWMRNSIRPSGSMIARKPARWFGLPNVDQIELPLNVAAPQRTQSHVCLVGNVRSWSWRRPYRDVRPAPQK